MIKKYFGITLSLVLTASIASSQNATFVWAKSQGTSVSDYPAEPITDPTGNIYTVGTFNGTSDFDPGPAVVSPTPYGQSDAYISKLDRDGNFLWVRSVGGTNLEVGKSIARDNSGNLIIIGTYAGTADFDPGPGSFPITSSASSDFFILKLDQNGNFIWAKSVGGALGEIPGSVSVDASGNVYATGYFRSATADFDPGPGVVNIQYYNHYDAFVLKLDPNGNYIWAKGFGSNNPEIAAQLALDNSGAVYVTGLFSGTADFDPSAAVFNITGAGTNDAYVVKLASDGAFVWAKSFGGASSDTRGVSIEVNSSGDIVTAGVFTGTADFDPGPSVFNLPSLGSDIYFVKLSSGGNFIWAKAMGGGVVNGIQSMKTDAAGNIYSAGLFQSTADFDPGPAEYNLTSPFAYGTFLSKIDNSGNFVWAYALGGASGGNLKSTITIDNVGDVVSVGSYSGTRDFDPGACVFNLPTQNIYSLKLRQSVASTDPTISSFSPTISPVGTTITITGTNFSTTPADNVVTFSNIPATVSASTATTITTSVPVGATTGRIMVTVGCVTTTSATDFTIGDLPNELTIYNAVSPGGANPKFVIQSIELIPETISNTVTIFDRWQNEVWKGTNYDNTSVVFTGTSSSGDLPTGTYYYKVEFTSGRKALTGFISLKR
ncbi:MAG: hypothetical protein HOP08_05705 [Cyclobacteriaceae bacterium]|nr:hypothetical protein [Cyclobacteriaceae bacterium]